LGDLLAIQGEYHEEKSKGDESNTVCPYQVRHCVLPSTIALAQIVKTPLRENTIFV
jgi:hypothetical protein